MANGRKRERKRTNGSGKGCYFVCCCCCWRCFRSSANPPGAADGAGAAVDDATGTACTTGVKPLVVTVEPPAATRMAVGAATDAPDAVDWTLPSGRAGDSGVVDIENGSGSSSLVPVDVSAPSATTLTPFTVLPIGKWLSRPNGTRAAPPALTGEPLGRECGVPASTPGWLAGRLPAGVSVPNPADALGATPCGLVTAEPAPEPVGEGVAVDVSRPPAALSRATSALASIEVGDANDGRWGSAMSPEPERCGVDIEPWPNCDGAAPPPSPPLAVAKADANGDGDDSDDERGT